MNAVDAEENERSADEVQIFRFSAMKNLKTCP
jgi:hypothetical protein